ncbi:unnamed protein product [Toxocara canis]|uniref:Bgal_small_N domain-containing protein n=1 Tax=Toxocara canis TaxID=6265 RepID=A0A183UQC9_TOXCA|nr:unnamed protein product [Toxocara canis]
MRPGQESFLELCDRSPGGQQVLVDAELVSYRQPLGVPIGIQLQGGVDPNRDLVDSFQGPPRGGWFHAGKEGGRGPLSGCAGDRLACLA